MRKAWLAAACALGLAAGWTVRAQEMDPLLKILVENKVITESQARAVQEEYVKRQAATETTMKESIEGGLDAKIKKSAPQIPSALKDLKIGGLWYLSYQNGNKYDGTPDETSVYSKFTVKRGYLNVEKKITPWFSVRFTPDVTQDSTGDLKVRMKYVYAKFSGKGNNFFGKPYTEIGMVHMPWLDFEEHINRYRMQDTMFMERNGLFNSADFGIMAGSNFGPELDEAFKKDVNDHYAGKYGSWQLGVFNGGGYHASEKNHNKVIEGRVTLRPLPEVIPGLQASYFFINGKGNVAEPQPPKELPDYKVNAFMLSYEHKYVALTGQYYTGKGNAKGDAVYASDGPGWKAGDARKMKGYSYFAEVRFPESAKWSVIGRYDNFDKDKEDPDSDRQKRTLFGVAYQFHKGNYVLLDYESLDHRDKNIPNENRFQVTMQVKF
ncbi:MAG: hypothetical protein ACOYXN_10960 [Acidobacteriota bacterium]